MRRATLQARSPALPAGHRLHPGLVPTRCGATRDTHDAAARPDNHHHVAALTTLHSKGSKGATRLSTLERQVRCALAALLPELAAAAPSPTARPGVPNRCRGSAARAHAPAPPAVPAAFLSRPRWQLCRRHPAAPTPRQPCFLLRCWRPALGPIPAWNAAAGSAAVRWEGGKGGGEGRGRVS